MEKRERAGFLKYIKVDFDYKDYLNLQIDASLYSVMVDNLYQSRINAIYLIDLW